MKHTAALSILFLSLLLTALLVNSKFGNTGKEQSLLKPSSDIRLLVTSGNDIITLTRVEYITGCVFAQMPANYEPEAIKAQAIAANTYAEKLMSLKQPKDSTTTSDNDDIANDNDTYDISDDPSTAQGYFNPDKAKEVYGTDYDKYLTIITAAAEYAATRVITYEGEPIYAVFTAISNGQSNTAESIWGRAFPYLESVNSEWDNTYAHFSANNERKPEDIRAELKEYDPSITMPIDYTVWFTDFVRNTAGYVDSVKVGDKVISGGDFWRLFGLRSMSFEVEYDGLNFKFVTKGYGHGAGLSQFGANILAGRGYTAEDIIKHYYTGVEITIY